MRVFGTFGLERLWTHGQLDLRALRSVEAAALLPELLPHLSASGLAAVTLLLAGGPGRTSASHKTATARLVPTVRKILVQEGYQFSPTALAADTVTHIHLHPMQQQRQHIDAIQVNLQW